LVLRDRLSRFWQFIYAWLHSLLTEEGVRR
jgi:hypothetical protein